MQARTSLLGGHEVINGLALLQPLLHLNEQLHAIHHHLHQLHLREAQAVCVGDIEDPTHSRCVYTTWGGSKVSRAVEGLPQGKRTACSPCPTYLCLASEAAAA